MSVILNNETDAAIGNATGTPPFQFNDYTQRAILATITVIIAAVGIVGNTMVNLAVLLSKKLRTTTNAFVVNLSAADLLACTVMPWNSVTLLSMSDMPVSEWVCTVVAVVLFTTVGCSICTLASIALNRFLLITRPAATYKNIYTPKSIASWLVVIWLIPLLVIIIPPLVDVGAFGYNRQYRVCGSLSSHARYNAYSLIIAGVLYPIPLITIIICYSLIWRHLYRQAKKFVKPPEEASSKDAINMEQTSPARANSTTLPSRTKRQTEVTKNMLYVVFGFGICSTPFAINLLFFNDSPGIPYTTVVLFFNSCLNPMIYATKHRDFKAVFGCILHCKWDDIPEPSESLKAIRRLKCGRDGLSA